MTKIKTGKIILAVDAGNTHIVSGIFHGNKLAAVARVASDSVRSPKAYRRHLAALLKRRHVAKADVKGVAVASVVPRLTTLLRRVHREVFKVPILEAGLGLKTGIRLHVRKPLEVGADRLCNAVAAARIYAGSTVVVDLGTATTFDCIRAGGIYAGGVIAAGPELAARSLAEHTARLPLVRMSVPKAIIGKDTVSCIRSGIFFGYRGLIKEIITRLKRVMPKPVRVIITGGHARFWAGRVPGIHAVVPGLTLEGLRILWEMNHEKR